MREDLKERIEKIKRGVVPEGYKRTRVGIIPESWKICKLSEVCIENGKYGINAAACEYKKNLPAYLRITDIDDEGNYIKTNNVCVDSDDSMKYILKENDIVFARTGGTVGKTYLFNPNDGELVYAGFLIKFSIDIQKYNKYILKSYCTTERYWNWINIMSVRSGQPGVNAEEYSKFTIPIPSMCEQKKIEKVLLLYDEKIKYKKKVLKEKNKQKKWLMHNLLTSKLRLKGFYGDWKNEKLGKLLLERNEVDSIESELLSITGSGIIPRSEIEGKDNSSEDKSKYKKIYIGDIGYNTMRMWQGVSAYSSYEGIVSPAYTILKPKDNVDTKFFSYLFKLPSIVFMFYRYSQGLVDDTRNLKYENFKKIKVNVPSDIEEQKAISHILTLADKEIEILQQQIEQIKLEKKAIMQLLLTGIVRVNQIGGE